MTRTYGRWLGAWAQLGIGLFGYALAVRLMIASRLGLGPWDSFHVGLSGLTGMSIGMANIVCGLLIVAASWWIAIRPGIGTLANMVGISIFLDLLQPLVPAAPSWSWALGYHVVGILLCGLTTGVYIGAGLGKGPRDGLMVGLSNRTGWPVRRVRTLIEIVVLACGWLMGGTIGLGTIMFAFGIGPAVQWGLRLCGVLDGPRGERTREQADKSTREQRSRGELKTLNSKL
ncbi:MAG TPA: hypothetical protein VFZ66_11865 [Herpetosiphonaceae bacterium]